MPLQDSQSGYRFLNLYFASSMSFASMTTFPTMLPDFVLILNRNCLWSPASAASQAPVRLLSRLSIAHPCPPPREPVMMIVRVAILSLHEGSRMPDPANPGSPSLPHSETPRSATASRPNSGPERSRRSRTSWATRPNLRALPCFRELQAVEAGFREKAEEPRVCAGLPARTYRTAAWDSGVEMPSQSTRDTVCRRRDAAAEDLPAHPAQIGKYRVEKVLGCGGFGTIYQGFDSVLKRDVAIKVPHPTGRQPEDVELYSEEGAGPGQPRPSPHRAGL